MSPIHHQHFFLSCSNLTIELNVLPVTAEGPLISLAKAPEGDSPDLAELKASLASTPPSGVLVALAKTIDQAKAVLTFIEAISEKTLRSTVALTAGRGRGKSAALGISMAAAIAYVSLIQTSIWSNHNYSWQVWIFQHFGHCSKPRKSWHDVSIHCAFVRSSWLQGASRL